MKKLLKKQNIIFVVLIIFVILSLIYIYFNKEESTMLNQEKQQNDILTETESETDSKEEGSCPRLFSKIFDGRLIELKSSYLVLINQEDNKEIKISLTAETKFSEMSFDGSKLNKEKDINLDYLVELNIVDEYKSLSVVSVCIEDNINDCQATEVKLIIESEQNENKD